MAVYFLDTDILSLYQLQDPTVTNSMSHHASDHICISSITIEEQISGWSSVARSAKSDLERTRSALLLVRLVTSWNRFTIIPMSMPALQRFDQLMKSKLNVKSNDLRIASIVLENAATLVTRNRRDFNRIPNLVFEDWSV